MLYCAESMSKFHASESGVLLSTDVAARGLDFPAVTHILQYDAPGDVPEYVQRVGRTARMGRRGVAILVLAPRELEYVNELKRAGVAIAQQKLFPSLDALPKPPELSKRAAAEGDAKRRQFQVAMDAGHMCEVRCENLQFNTACVTNAASVMSPCHGAMAVHRDGVF